MGQLPHLPALRDARASQARLPSLHRPGGASECDFLIGRQGHLSEIPCPRSGLLPPCSRGAWPGHHVRHHRPRDRWAARAYRSFGTRMTPLYRPRTHTPKGGKVCSVKASVEQSHLSARRVSHRTWLSPACMFIRSCPTTTTSGSAAYSACQVGQDLAARGRESSPVIGRPLAQRRPPCQSCGGEATVDTPRHVGWAVSP
jgi:hypothetical protein